MAELENTVLWINDEQTELYLSRYKQDACNPLAKFKVTSLNVLVSHNLKTNDLGPCYPSISDQLSIEVSEHFPYKNIIGHSYYEALLSQRHFDLCYTEFDVNLENGLNVQFLLGGDLFVQQSNYEINQQLISYELLLEGVSIDPYWLYILDSDSNNLIRTRHFTKHISDFVLSSPEYFFDIDLEV